MIIRILFSVFSCILFNTVAYSQKVIVIDTIEDVCKKCIIANCEILDAGDPNTRELLEIYDNGMKFPNLIISKFEFDSLCFKLDNNGGVLKMKGISRFKADTIHIAKLGMYDIATPDTSFITDIVWQVENGKRIDPAISQKNSIDVKSNNISMPNVSSVPIIINGRTHVVDVVLEKYGPMQTSISSYSPARIVKKYNNRKNSSKVYRYKYKYKEINTYSHRYSAMLTL